MRKRIIAGNWKMNKTSPEAVNLANAIKRDLADVEGVEWSRPLAWLARWRARSARVRRGDLWADDWAPFALVYVFQRPESMPRVWAKACANAGRQARSLHPSFIDPRTARDEPSTPDAPAQTSRNSRAG